MFKIIVWGSEKGLEKDGELQNKEQGVVQMIGLKRKAVIY